MVNALHKGFSQICVIGVLAFLGPGLFNALNGLGAVGTGDSQIAAVANGCLYGAFAIVGYFAGSILNIIGPKMSMTLGGLAYAVYAICNYYSYIHVSIAAIGGLILGCGAGVFWVGQMALCLAYSTEERKTFNMSVFWAIFNAGGVFGGLLQCGLNFSLFEAESGGLYTEDGNSATPAAYFAFIGLMCLSPILAPFLLVDPRKVIKADGTAPEVREADTFINEIKAAAVGITDPFTARMIVYFLFSNWFYTYEFGYLNNYFFNSRFAGLNSGLYWGAQMLGAAIIPFVVDKKGWSKKKQGWGGLVLNVVFLVISWMLAIVINFTSCNGRVEKPNGVTSYEYPRGGVYKSMAWFPDVCDQYAADFESAGETCNDGCDFLDKCRFIGSSTGPLDKICDPSFPRCATEEETAKCGLDLVIGESPVCSLRYYVTIGADSVSITSKDAGEVCDGANLSAINENGESSIIVVDSDYYSLYDDPRNWPGDLEPSFIRGSNMDGTINDSVVQKYCSAMVGVCEYTNNKCSVTVGGQTELDEMNPGFLCITPDVNYASESSLLVIDYIFMGVSDAIFQVYVLWLIGAFAGADLSLNAQYAAAYKGIQSLGAAIAWGSDYSESFTYGMQMWICIAFGTLAILGSAWTVPLVKEGGVEASPVSVSSSESKEAVKEGRNSSS